MAAMGCALLLGVLVLAGIYPQIQCSTLPKDQSDSDGEKSVFSFEDIFDTKFDEDYFSGRWIKDTLVYKDDSGNLMSQNVSSWNIDVLVNATVFKNNSIATYAFSNDMRYMLFSYDYKQRWRYSYDAKYKIFDLENSGTDSAIIDFPNSDTLKNKDLLYAKWAPKGLRISFVYANNVWYQDGPFGTPQQLTTTGEELYIFNGAPNWLYEEDVLGSRTAQYWSPDAKNLLYATFNDTGVPLIEWPVYGPRSDIYGKTQRVTYPKAGSRSESGGLGPNTQVNLHMWNFEDEIDNNVDVPQAFREIDHYLLQVVWINSTYFMVTWSNRAQNHSITSICSVSLQCDKHLETRYPRGWIRVPPQEPFFFDGGERYVTIRSKDEGTSGAWRHVALVSPRVNAEDTVTFLTGGQTEVTSILGVDKTSRLVFYRLSPEDPKDREIYRVGLPDAARSLRQAVCLTCDGECTYNGASFSPSGEHYIRKCLGPGVPYNKLFLLQHPDNGKLLSNNTKLEEAVDSKLLPTRQFLKIPVGGGYMAHAEVFFPPGFSEDKKYPLLISTYGGPDSQEVLSYFPLLGSTGRWTTHLGSALGAVVVSVDGRGAGGRGDKYTYELFRRMGTVEVEDQAYAARYFKAKPYIDDSKGVAIFGWSYGGEVSSHALADYPIFDCAIAVAPVTSKRYYDTAYTERVMGFDLPTDNEKGYNDSDITRKAANMTGKQYFLAHGTLDDNVHFMNSAQMVQALTAAEVQFKFQMYVDEPHAIRNRQTSLRHLMRAMTDFLRYDCWDMTDDDEAPDDIVSGARKNCVPGTIITALITIRLILTYLYIE